MTLFSFDTVRFKFVAVFDSGKMVYMANMLLIIILITSINGCLSAHKVNGWYPVADIPENKIDGDAIITTEDFAMLSLDTVSFSDMAVIEVRLKVEKIQKWAEVTESRIGKRIGFVYNDSVIMAPTVNCRIESGCFTINSKDKKLILQIYDSLRENDK